MTTKKKDSAIPKFLLKIYEMLEVKNPLPTSQSFIVPFINAE